MLLVRRTLCVVAIGVAPAASCSSPTSPKIPAATVLVQRDTLVAALLSGGSVRSVRFTAPVAIHNAGPATIKWVGCAMAVEARIGATWETVWTPVCALASASGLEIPAGEMREVTILVDGSIEGPTPQWSRPDIAGTYRFTMGLSYAGVGGPIPMIASNTFTLTVE